MLASTETFATLLRSHRQRRQLTQGAVASAAGFDRSYISYLEQHKRNPTRDVVLKLADVLGLVAEERDGLLLSAQFAAEQRLDPSDHVIELIARSLSDLPPAQREKFRTDVESHVSYLLERYRHEEDTAPYTPQPGGVQQLAGG